MDFTAEKARQMTPSVEKRAEEISKDIISFIKLGLETGVITKHEIRIPQDYHQYTEILCSHDSTLRNEISYLLHNKGFFLKRGLHRNDAVISWEKRETLLSKILSKILGR